MSDSPSPGHGRPALRPPETPPGPWYFRPTVFLVVAAVGVAVWALGRPYLGLTPPTPSVPAAAPATDPASPAGPATTAAVPAVGAVESRRREAEAMAADTARRDLVARAKVAQRRAADLGDEAARAADEGAHELDRWDADAAALLTGDAGRAVAGQPHLVRAFRALHEAERPSRAEFAGLKAQAEALAEPARKALAEPDNAWSQTDEAEKRLTAVLARARSQRDAVRAARLRVESVAALARGGPPAGVTLQAAVQALDYREGLEAAAAIDAARDKARQEAVAEMARVRGEAVRLAGQADARREAAKAEVERTRVELEAAALTAKAEKDRLRAKARTPEVQQDLAVFLAKGYTQPVQPPHAYERTPGVLAAVSYSRIKTLGALEPTPQGLAKLLRLGAEPGRANDRPRWRFAPFELRPESEPFVRRVQQLLIELGPVLVEDGLLAP